MEEIKIITNQMLFDKIKSSLKLKKNELLKKSIKTTEVELFNYLSHTIYSGEILEKNLYEIIDELFNIEEIHFLTHKNKEV